MGNVRFHHNSKHQFLFQTPDGITLNIPPSEEFVMEEADARFILEQIKDGGGSYTATDKTNVQNIVIDLPVTKRSHKKKT